MTVLTIHNADNLIKFSFGDDKKRHLFHIDDSDDNAANNGDLSFEFYDVGHRDSHTGEYALILKDNMHDITEIVGTLPREARGEHFRTELYDDIVTIYADNKPDIKIGDGLCVKYKKLKDVPYRQ